MEHNHVEDWTPVSSFVVISSAACTPASEPTPTPLLPTRRQYPIVAVTQNSEWTPVIETFNGLEMVVVPPGCFLMGGMTVAVMSVPPLGFV